MPALCVTKTLQAEYLKETGREFYEWQGLLLSVQHPSKTAALFFIQLHGLSKAKAEFLLGSTESLMEFTLESK